MSHFSGAGLVVIDAPWWSRDYLELHRTFSGLEATLTLRGFGRFLGAGFLLVWLAGWFVGEAFVLWFLFVGAKSLVTGEPPEPGRDPLALAPALAVGLFLLFWLALWTFGGVAAIYELLRLLWSRDRLIVRRDEIEIQRRIGWLSTVLRVERTELRGICRRAPGAALVAPNGIAARTGVSFSDSAGLAQLKVGS